MPGRTRPLEPHEVQQAGYQLGARLVGEPIEDADTRKHLAEATETIHQTRLDHRYGRGNIASDIVASRNESSARTAAVAAFVERGDDDVTCGVSLALGAGICDFAAAINARRQAAKMEPGGKTQTVLDSFGDHAYAVYDPPARQQPAGVVHEALPTIVLDSWASGPAVRFQDSAWREASEHGTVVDAFDKESGERSNAIMEQARADATSPGFFGKRTALYSQSRAELKKFRAKPFFFRPYEAKSVVDPELASEARRRWNVPPHLSKDAAAAGATREDLDARRPLHRDVLAAGAARQSYNVSVAQATNRKTLDEVLTYTGNLTSLDRPPIRSRRFRR